MLHEQPPADRSSALTFKAEPLAGRSGCQAHVTSLKIKLAITRSQSGPWSRFAEALRMNARRMTLLHWGEPFSRVEERLAALARMRDAAAELFAVLGSDQRRRAVQLLPLCCLPGGAIDAANRSFAA